MGTTDDKEDFFAELIQEREALIQRIVDRLSNDEKCDLVYGGKTLELDDGVMMVLLPSTEIEDPANTQAFVVFSGQSGARTRYNSSVRISAESFARLAERVDESAPWLANEVWELSQHLTDLYQTGSSLTNELMVDVLHTVKTLSTAPASLKRWDKQRLARRRHAPMDSAKDLIRSEWFRWQANEVKYSSDADFGRKMHAKHTQFVSDRSIAQLSAKWRREARETSG